MSRLPALPNAVAPGAQPPARGGVAVDSFDDPRRDLAARFGDGRYWQLVLRVMGATDPVTGAFLVALRRAGGRISSVPQPNDLTPEGPAPDWRLCAGAIPAAAWPRWRAQAARLAPRLAPWLKLAPQDERGDHARAS